MEEPLLSVEAVKAVFEQTGIASAMPEEFLTLLNDAISALGESLAGLRDMGLPDARPEAYHGWTIRLLGLFDDLVMNLQVVGNPMRFSVCWAWWVTLNRQAKALLNLYDAGLASDAAPLLRSITEYALWCVALSWDDGPLLNTIMRAGDDEDDKLIKNLNEGPVPIPPEVMALVNSVPRVAGEGSPTKSFMAVCRSLGVSGTVLPVWRFLSSVSHPTTAVAYLLTVPSVEGVKVKKTLGLPGLGLDLLSDQAVATMTQCLLWAGFAIDRLIEGNPLRAQLQEIADEAGVTELKPQTAADGPGSASAS